MGYKVAYSERMVTLFTTIFCGGLLFSLVRSRLRPLGILLFLLIGVVPIGLDGFSHLLSDRTGWGFRDTNAWLTWLTSYRFAPSFYVGDAVGSANWWLRQVTGLLSGLAIVWFVYPGIDQRIARIQAGQRARGRKRLPAKPKQEIGTA